MSDVTPLSLLQNQWTPNIADINSQYENHLLEPPAWQQEDPDVFDLGMEDEDLGSISRRETDPFLAKCPSICSVEIIDLEQIPDVIQVDQWSLASSYIKLKADGSPLGFQALDENGDEIEEHRCLAHLNWSLNKIDDLWTSAVILSLDPPDVAPTAIKIDDLNGDLDAGAYFWELSLEDRVRENKTYTSVKFEV